MSATQHLTEPPPAFPDMPRADQLRMITEWLDQHPDASVTQVDFLVWQQPVAVRDYSAYTAADLAAKSKAIGGRWDKAVEHGMFVLRQEIAPGLVYELTALRDEVCTKVVTGTKTKTVTEPDPDLVAALPTIERVETVETFEWQCGPLLANSQAA